MLVTENDGDLLYASYDERTYWYQYCMLVTENDERTYCMLVMMRGPIVPSYDERTYCTEL